MALSIIALVLITMTHTVLSRIDCCNGTYAPHALGCASNDTDTSLVCVHHLDACQECVLSKEWTPEVECHSCCVHDYGGCLDDAESSLAWVLSLVLSILLCICCAGLLIRYERRRRRDDTVLLAHAQRMTSPLAEAQVTSTLNKPAVVVDDQPPRADSTDGDLPIARLATPAQGIPIPSTRSTGIETLNRSPLDIGSSISDESLLNNAQTV